MRRLFDNTEEALLLPYRNFKFLLSLQGFKSFSFLRYNDLTQFESQWFRDPEMSDNEIRPMLLFKGYLKGIRSVTRDVLLGDWLDFNGLLQQGVERMRRLADWDENSNEEDYEHLPLSGDDVDELLHRDRRRQGPSLLLASDMSQFCDGQGCDTCGVWVDIAAEVGCAGQVTVWNHSHCFDVVNCLIGRGNFVAATEWRTGVRMDEVGTMPGLGGVGFVDRRSPSHGVNSPTPYIQLYCQEKVPTYAPFGSKARGAHNLDQIPARKLPMRYMLLCDGQEDNQLERWIAAENRILDEPSQRPAGSFPARMEIRTSLDNLLEATYNNTIALSRATKSDAFRHYNKNDWFRWKKIRAEYTARLPGTIFGNREARPSDWTIQHVLLAAQSFVHGLHSRVSDITTERDTVNMHSLYLRVETRGGSTTYEHPDVVLTLKERSEGDLYCPFFPGGVRTLHEYFHPIFGLKYSQFEERMRSLSSTLVKWKTKVRRNLGCIESSGIRLFAMC